MWAVAKVVCLRVWGTAERAGAKGVCLLWRLRCFGLIPCVVGFVPYLSKDVCRVIEGAGAQCSLSGSEEGSGGLPDWGARGDALATIDVALLEIGAEAVLVYVCLHTCNIDRGSVDAFERPRTWELETGEDVAGSDLEDPGCGDVDKDGGPVDVS